MQCIVVVLAGVVCLGIGIYLRNKQGRNKTRDVC